VHRNQRGDPDWKTHAGGGGNGLESDRHPSTSSIAKRAIGDQVKATKMEGRVSFYVFECSLS
jgi:hypothetical protein